MKTPIKGLIFDIDGTILRGDVMMPGVHDLLPKLRARGLKLAFLTNDNRQTIDQWMIRLRKVGVMADELVTSAVVAAEAVAHLFPERTVLPIGDTGLIQAITRAGLRIVKEQADVVVMGKDPNFNQATLNQVCQQIWQGAKFVATNNDRKMPVADGYIPATGAMVQAVAYATGVPPIVVGKPSTHAAEVVLERMGLSAENVIMIGDSISSDIRMGNNAQMRTVLVLTGTSQRTDVDAASTLTHPSYIVNDLTELIPTLFGESE